MVANEGAMESLTSSLSSRFGARLSMSEPSANSVHISIDGAHVDLSTVLEFISSAPLVAEWGISR